MNDNIYNKTIIEQGLILIKELRKSDYELKLDHENFINRSKDDFTFEWSLIDSLTNYFNKILENKKLVELFDNWKDKNTKERINILRREGKLKYHESFEGLDEDFIHEQMIDVALPKFNTIARLNFRILLANFIEAVNLKLLDNINEIQKSNLYIKEINFNAENGNVYLDGIEIGKIKVGTMQYKLFNLLYLKLNKPCSFEEMKKDLEIGQIQKTTPNYFSGIKNKLDIDIRKLIKNSLGGYVLYNQTDSREK